MKIILKKTDMFTVITTLCLVVVTLFVASGCDKTEVLPNHTITFAGEGVGIEAQSITHGTYATEPENPKREGYNFAGWFIDNDTFTNEWDFKTDIVTQDTTLYAKWEEDTLQEITLQGTKWKLIGIIDVQTSELTELEPKDCDECYTLTFDTNNTFSGQITNNVISLGNYEIDYMTKTLRITDIIGTEAIDIGDGYLYRQILWEVQSFIVKDAPRELHLYYSDSRKYLKYKKIGG